MSIVRCAVWRIWPGAENCVLMNNHLWCCSPVSHLVCRIVLRSWEVASCDNDQGTMKIIFGRQDTILWLWTNHLSAVFFVRSQSASERFVTTTQAVPRALIYKYHFIHCYLIVTVTSRIMAIVWLSTWLLIFPFISQWTWLIWCEPWLWELLGYQSCYCQTFTKKQLFPFKSYSHTEYWAAFPKHWSD